MMTKQQEREALERIKNILSDAGKDSYIGIAFAGCVKDAESNIENDWACSMAERWKSSEKQVNALQSEIVALKAELDAMQAEISERDAQISDLKKAAEALNGWGWEERASMEREKDRADAAEAEIIRLKAKLYDFMTAVKD